MKKQTSMGGKKDHSEKKSYQEYLEPGYINLTPVWAFKWYDYNYPRWSFANCDDIEKKILLKLKDFEGMTWREIQSASGGKSPGHGTNSHFEKISEMCKDAQNRARELRIDRDELFSLRLEGKVRLYGILEGHGVFSIIWYDRDHEIYPAKV